MRHATIDDVTALLKILRYAQLEAGRLGLEETAELISRHTETCFEEARRRLDVTNRPTI